MFLRRCPMLVLCVLTGSLVPPLRADETRPVRLSRYA